MLFGVVSFAGGSLGCRAPKAPVEGPPAEGAIVARVGSTSISSAEFTQKALNQPPVVRASLTSLEKKKEFLERLIRHELLMQESAREGFDKDPEVKEAKEQGMPEDKLREKMANEMLHDKFDKDPALKGIPEPDLRAYYVAHQSEFVKPDRVHLEIILLTGKETDRKVLAEAQRLLADLREKAARGNGGAFATTARVRSDDEATKPRGGDTALRTEEDLVQAYGPKVAEAATALKNPGDMSEVVRGKTGWYLIKLMARQNALNETFDQVAPMIEKRLLSEKRTALIEAWIKELRAKTAVVVYDAELNRIDLQAHPSPPSK
jgi:hypothetical protein